MERLKKGLKQFSDKSWGIYSTACHVVAIMGYRLFIFVSSILFIEFQNARFFVKDINTNMIVVLLHTSIIDSLNYGEEQFMWSLYW